MTNARKSDLVIVVAIVIAQGVVTCLTYSSYGRFLFAQGSDSGYVVVRPSLWVASLVLGACAIASLVVWRVASRAVLMGAVAALFAAWVFSGRAVGVGFQFDYKIVAGYFFVRTATFQPMAGVDGAELKVDDSQSILGFLGVVELRSGSRREDLIIGPLCGRPIISLLRSVERGPKSLRPADFGEGVFLCE